MLKAVNHLIRKSILLTLALCFPLTLFADTTDYQDLPTASPPAANIFAAAGIDVASFRLPVDNHHGCVISLYLKKGARDKEIEVCRKVSKQELQGKSEVDVIITMQEVRGFFGRRKIRVGYMVAGCNGSTLVSNRNLPYTCGEYPMIDPQGRVLLAAAHAWALPAMDSQETALYLKASPWDEKD